MKSIMLFILLFLLAVAISPMLIGEKGYILIAMGNITIESTVVTAAVLLFFSMIALFIVLRVISGSVSFSFSTWRKFSLASKRKAKRNFRKSVAAYILGDYKTAETLSVKSAEPIDNQDIAYLIAADSAQKQENKANTLHYLQYLESSENTKHHIESALVRLNTLMALQEYKKARELLDEYHRHIGHESRLLALEISLSLAELRFDHAIEYLVRARKDKNIGEDEVCQWERVAFTGQFNLIIREKSNDALHNYWQDLPRKVKQRETVISCYAHVLAENNIQQGLSKVLLPLIKPGTNAELLKTLRDLPLTKADDLIANVQKIVQKQPENGVWLSYLGHVAGQTKDWDMASKAFHSLAQLEHYQMDKQDYVMYSKALIAQNKIQEANDILVKALA
ncbi:heme biosynthesis protein HemY [Thalassotalea sp. LPB0316]|uniref:heme biosynthesis HemY N-terminal domain-containing protein n=1 Tax=Thalassotalea sp. LPB0316 TaxID=2769490 RepID=UPI001865E970|nr:heme biosynthesis HemY N-terminal domain-containing protein [Thalassotalea sp. LPB0316]QOL26304.1 heme biosynthesis protein HemY [Thalassotalea sp. LPB0316]